MCLKYSFIEMNFIFDFSEYSFQCASNDILKSLFLVFDGILVKNDIKIII